LDVASVDIKAPDRAPQILPSPVVSLSRRTEPPDSLVYEGSMAARRLDQDSPSQIIPRQVAREVKYQLDHMRLREDHTVLFPRITVSVSVGIPR